MSKINLIFKGKNYSIDESLLASAFSELQTAFGDLESGGGSTPEVITYYTQEDIDNSDGKLVAIGETNPLYVVADFSEDLSILTITKNGDDSDGLMMPNPFYEIFKEEMEEMYGLPVTTIIIENGVTNISNSAFNYFGDNFTNIVIPDSVTSIGDEAFSFCSGLTSITIPNSITSIGKGAFSSCFSLPSITIPNSVTSIGRTVFYWCSGLTSITIPNSITSIGESAFEECWSLTSIIIPDSVTSIDDWAFSNCKSMTNITIPNSITSISDHMFSDCKNLTNIIFKGTVSQWNAITKGNYWNQNVPAAYVQCSDGQVAL